MLFRLVVLTVLCQSVMSYKMFQKKIPNGENVPFPCKPGQTWQGVGHFIDEGTGTKNPFGIDFAAAGREWTPALCKKDSDGDGQTNGQELGDPDCVWNENATAPNRTEGLSHPGICDPWNSTVCEQKNVTGGKYATQQEWLADMCKSDELECPALSEPDLLHVSVRIPPGTRVPAKETTYECQIFDLHSLGVQRDQEFHMVAVTPIIDNRNVLHHMVISGCEDNTQTTSGPFHCDMLASQKCTQFLHVWTVGLNGECYHPQSGIRIGQHGYKIVAIQLHWNNPGQSDSLTDSSGLKLYYTPKLRPYDAGVLMIGSTSFYLPPKQQEVIVHSTCGSGCTNKTMLGPLNITSAWNHMHYTGRKMSIEVKRNNNHVTYLTDDKLYSYDSPEVHSYQSPFVLLPGDELLTTCGFNTMNRNKTTFYGEGTPDEMCFGFITYYPVQNITQPFCLDMLEVSMCSPATWGDCKNLDKFIVELQNSTLLHEVEKNCQIYAPCVPECVETLIKYKKSEPCLSGKAWNYLQDVYKQSQFGKDFMGRLVSCQTESTALLNPRTPTCIKTDGSALGIKATWSLVLLTLLVMMLQKMI